MEPVRLCTLGYTLGLQEPDTLSLTSKGKDHMDLYLFVFCACIYGASETPSLN
jgi:hypothetical protein